MTTAETITAGSLAGRTIHVIPYAHLDVAWVHTRAWHLDRYTRILDEVLDRLDSDSEYCFYIDTWTECLKDYRHLRPRNVARLRRHIRSGRLAICGGHYGNVRSTMVGDETFIRNLQLGMRHWRKLAPEVQLKVYADMDVTLGHSQMPQLLGQAGLEGYFVDRPLHLLDEQKVPRAFVWEGLSGDKILVCRAHYGGLYLDSERHGTRWDENWPAVAEGLRQTYFEAPGRDEVTNVAMCVGSDDARPDKFLLSYDRDCNYSDLMHEWNAREAGRMQYSTPDQLFSALAAERKQLKTVSGTLDPADVCYNTAPHGRQGIWWLREQADRRLVEAEILSTVQSLKVGAKYPERQLTDAWEKLLDYTPHAVQWLFREDWQAAQMSLREAIQSAEQAGREAGAELVGGGLAMDSEGLALINTTGQARREVAPLWILNGDQTHELARLVDAQGRAVPFQIVDCPISNAECSLLAEVETPACGYTTLRLEWSPVAPDAPSIAGDIVEGSYDAYWKKRNGLNGQKPYDKDKFQLSSGTVRASFEGGQLVAIRDLAAGVTRRAPQGTSFLEPVHYALPSPNWFIGEGIPDNPDPFKVEDIRIDEQGPLRWRVTRTGRTGGYWVRQHLDLYKGERGVRATTQFMAPAENESNYIALSMPLPKKATLTADIPFGIEKRNLGDFAYGGAERAIPGFFWARTWAAARDDKGMMALLAADGDKFFRDWGNPRRLVHILARKTMVFERGWEAYIDTYDLGGRQIFEHQLILDDAETPDLALVKRAERLRHPLRQHDVPASRLGVEEEWLGLKPETVSLSALYREGQEVFARLVQMGAEKAETVVRLPLKPKSAVLVDFLGNQVGGKLACKGNEVRLTLKPWQVATLKLQLK